MVSDPSASDPSASGPAARRFALLLFLPALVVLAVTTTAPLVYLAWTSAWRIDLSMPWQSGFAGFEHYAKMAGDPRYTALVSRLGLPQ